MNLSERIKGYERVSNVRLTKRTPVIIRLDGRAFHTLCKGFKKPFDEQFIKIMSTVAKRLCEKIQNAKFAYVQSDEISILMTDWKNLDTEAFFDNKVQKITSITASMATAFFIEEWYKINETVLNVNFDSRAFNVPDKEVVNYFIWRQQDWTRNSIQMVGQSKFSQKQLEGKTCNEIQEMLFKKHNINWDSYPIYLKRGRCIVKELTKYKVDLDIPIFTQNREYISERLMEDVI